MGFPELEIHVNELPVIPDHIDAVAIDTEMFDMEKRRLHRETGKFACMTIGYEKVVYIYEYESLVPLALERVKDKIWVFYNATFDLFHLRRWADVPERNARNLYDVMIMDRLLWNGYYNDFSLENSVRRELSLQMDKNVRKKFEKAGQMNAELRKYSCEDAYATYAVYQKQQTYPHYPKAREVWDKIEGDMIETVLNFKGFSLDVDKWTANAEKFDKISRKIREELDFNPASPKQVKEALAKERIFISSTAASVLEKYPESPTAQSVLEFRGANKLASTYGMNFIYDFLEKDNKIYANYWTIGAQTGRMASSNPNMQNIPKTATFRSCFIPAKGHKLAVADYSQQEPRITAHLSKDSSLLDAIWRGVDLHLYVTRKIFSDETIEKSDERRYIGKQINLGLTYGLTPWGLRRNTGLDLSECERLVNEYFNQFSGVHNWIERQHWFGENQNYVETEIGRRTWLNPWSRRLYNISVNAPVQGGAADQTKLALVLLKQEFNARNEPYPVVAVVHDEIVLEAPENLITCYAGLAKDAMLEAGHMLYPSVPWKADPAIGDSWAVK